MKYQAKEIEILYAKTVIGKQIAWVRILSNGELKSKEVLPRLGQLLQHQIIGATRPTEVNLEIRFVVV